MKLVLASYTRRRRGFSAARTIMLTKFVVVKDQVKPATHLSARDSKDLVSSERTRLYLSKKGASALPSKVYVYRLSCFT